MKHIVNKLFAYLTFVVVFFLHIYFALLLTARPAFAQDTVAATEPATVEKVDAKPAAPEAVAPEAPKAPKVKALKIPKPPAPPKIDLSDDINIKFNMKEGLTVKGVDKVIEKAKELEKYEHEMEERSGRKHRHSHFADDENENVEDEDSEDSGDLVHNEKIIIHKGSSKPVEILVPIGFFAMIFGIVFLVISSKQKARKDYLETVRLMVEKGQPIPEDLMKNLTPQSRVHGVQFEQYHSHLIKGLKPIFWGLGIILFFLSTELVDGPWFLGFIPLLIGAYYVTKSYLIEKEKQKNPQPVVDATKPETK